MDLNEDVQHATGLQPPPQALEEDVAISTPTAAPSRPRRPSVSNACDRCRRRKIRCDDNQPCATCARFRLNCVKQGRQRDRSRSTHSALEERIRRLELQLDRAQQPQSLEDSSQLWPESMQMERPELRLDTSIDSLSSSYSGGTPDDGTYYDFSAGANVSPSIPTIEITQFETRSPHPWSPSPSLVFSSSSRASTPELLAVSTPLLGATTPSASGLSPPGGLGYSHLCGPGYPDELSTHLSASHATAAHSNSRRSSFSSDILLPDSLDLLKAESQFLQPEPQVNLTASDNAFQLSFQPPPLPTGFELADRILPTSDQALALSSTYFRIFPPSNLAANMAIFRALHGALYSLPSPLSSPLTPETSNILAMTSLCPSMARFHLFMTLAIGLKLNIRQRKISQAAQARSSAETSNPEIDPLADESMMSRCYHAAMSQVNDVGASFWDLNGGVDAADMMLKFAIARGNS